jgi:hypothetical protein
VGFGINNDFFDADGMAQSPDRLYEVELYVGEFAKAPCPYKTTLEGPRGNTCPDPENQDAIDCQTMDPIKHLCVYGDWFYQRLDVRGSNPNVRPCCTPVPGRSSDPARSSSSLPTR